MSSDKSLRDYTVSNFKHDCITSGFTAIEKPLKLGAWNYVKLVKKPNGVAVYFNSKNDFLNARVLNDSNRGEKIIKENDNGEFATYQNLFVWIIDNGFNTLASDSFVEIEYSGENVAIEPLLGNTFSLSKIDTIQGVERTAGVNYIYPLENFLIIKEFYLYQQSLSQANNIKIENNLKQILAKEAEIEVLKKEILFEFEVGFCKNNSRISFTHLGKKRFQVKSNGDIVTTSSMWGRSITGYFKNNIFYITDGYDSMRGYYEFSEDSLKISYNSYGNGNIAKDMYSCSRAENNPPIIYKKISDNMWKSNQSISHCSIAWTGEEAISYSKIWTGFQAGYFGNLDANTRSKISQLEAEIKALKDENEAILAQAQNYGFSKLVKKETTNNISFGFSTKYLQTLQSLGKDKPQMQSSYVLVNFLNQKAQRITIKASAFIANSLRMNENNAHLIKIESVNSANASILKGLINDLNASEVIVESQIPKGIIFSTLAPCGSFDYESEILLESVIQSGESNNISSETIITIPPFSNMWIFVSDRILASANATPHKCAVHSDCRIDIKIIGVENV